MSTDIILFDIPTNKGIPTSPSTWKVRLALNYKKLNYQTHWIPTTEIENVTKPLGILPTGIKPNGSPHWTLPAIIDRTNPSHPILLSDSMPIVEYLERTYPASPGAELFPANTRAFQVIVMQFVMPKLQGVVPDLILSAMYAAKSPEEQKDFRVRMEARFKKPFENIEKQGAEREAAFRELGETLSMLTIAFQQNNEGIFFMGCQVSFADFAIAAWLIMIKVASPNDIWARIVELDGGTWKRYLEGFHDWMSVDEGTSMAKSS